MRPPGGSAQLRFRRRAWCRTIEMCRPGAAGTTGPIPDGGEFGFDGGMESRDACRAPLTRKTDGPSVNCGYSVRSRCLISSDVRPGLAWWLGAGRHETGWLPDGGSASGGEMSPGLVPGGFSPLPHAGHEIAEADTHVESHEDVLSDAGSTPAASTTPSLRSVLVSAP
jgi:hypothetical protein